MKRWFLIHLLLFSCALEALPLGNPAEAELFCEGIFFNSFCNFLDFRAGYYGDFVFERHLRVDNNSLADHVRRTKILTNAGYLDVNICRRLDVFATLGKTRMTIEANALTWAESAVSLVATDTLLFLTPGFSWSVGARGILYKWRCWVLGLEGQYFRANPKIDKFEITGEEATHPVYLNGQARFKEWQVGAALSYEIIGCFPNALVVPYIGVKYSRVRFESNNFSFLSVDFVGNPLLQTIFDCGLQQHWGFPFGVTLLFNRCFGFTLEGRFGDERAFSLLVQGRF